MKNLYKVNIPDSLINELEKIFKSCEEIKKVVLFGSRARKDNRENSDIDIAIYSTNKQNSKIYSMFDEINTLYSFDIVFISSDTSINLVNQIKKDGCIIYER